MHFFNLHVCSVLFHKDLFLALSLLFLIYNNMSQAVKCNLFLYAGDTCLFCQHKDINEVEKQLSKRFLNPW